MSWCTKIARTRSKCRSFTISIQSRQELSKRHRRTCETQYAHGRTLHVAHNVLVDANARWAMFQKTRLRDFEKLIVFLDLGVLSARIESRRSISGILLCCVLAASPMEGRGHDAFSSAGVRASGVSDVLRPHRVEAPQKHGCVRSNSECGGVCTAVE